MDKWLNSRWFARAIALLLATMMWMVVNQETDGVTPADSSQPLFVEGVNLRVLYDSDNFEVVKQPKTVKIMIESSNPFYKHNFFPPDSEIYADVRGKGKGTHKVPVQSKGFPEGTKVGIIPSTVEITLEEKQTVEKEVSVEVLGQTAPGYTAGEPIVKPFRVHVKVPESQVNNIASVRASVPLEGTTEPINVTVPLKVLDKFGNVLQKVEINPLTVEVNVPVTSPFVKVPIKMNLTNDLPDGYSLASVEKNAEEVTVYGPKEVIDAIKISTYPGPEIDLSKINSDRLVQLKMPLLDKVVKVEPEYLEVSLKVAPSQTKRLEKVPLRITGLAENEQAKVFTASGQEITTIDFDLIGAEVNLKDITAEDVQVVADVSSLPLGVHEIPIVYNLPAYLKAAPPALKQITVEITNK
ncbi:MAG: YbbR-like domain-containing protein [Clostridia bacterium]